MRNGAQALRRNRTSGVAMIVVLCIAAIVLSLSLALIYSSSVLLATSNQKMLREQCYQLARSFSEVVTGELCIGAVPSNTPSGSELFDYANKFLEGFYAEFNPDNPDGTTFDYVLSSGNDKDVYGAITVSIYKEGAADDEENAANNPIISLEGATDSNLGDVLSKAEKQQYIDYNFNARVTASRNGDSFAFTKRYYRSVVYAVKYSLKAGGTPLYRSGTDGKWYKTPALTDPYTGAITKDTLVAQYDLKNIISRQFQLEGSVIDGANPEK